MHPTHIPLRVATGALILNAGVNKLKADDEAAEQSHGWASSVYPVFQNVKPQHFMRMLGLGEIGLGALLLLPTVPSAVAGAALTGFGAGLMGLYLKTPGMTEKDGIRPTAEGTSLSKDVWLVGAGLTLATQSFLSGTKNAAKSVANSAHSAREDLTDTLSDLTGSITKR